MKNLFDINEIASRAGITNEICARIIYDHLAHRMAGAVNAMIVGTAHRAELEEEARAILGK